MNWTEFKNVFNDAEIVEQKLVIKNNLAKTLKFIKDNYNFEILKGITAIDNKEEGIELIYHLYNIEDEENLLVSITAKNEIETITFLL